MKLLKAGGDHVSLESRIDDIPFIVIQSLTSDPYCSIKTGILFSSLSIKATVRCT